VARSVIVGGSSGLGLVIAKRLVARGEEVVVTSRDATRAATGAIEIGASLGIAVDLAHPETLADAFEGIGEVDNLVITAIEQAVNSFADFDIEQAVRSVTVKLVGYTEVVRALHPRFTADAAVATVGNAREFKQGRQMAAWLGLVPTQHSSGGHARLGEISCRGDAYLRTLLIHGARSAILAAKNKVDNTNGWLTNLLQRRHPNIAAVALANKNVRTVWAILGAGLYLGLVSVFALGLGTILRAGAGGIAAALGVVFLLPIIVTIVNSLTNVDWLKHVPQYLISSAGQALAGSKNADFAPWQNVLVVVVWTAVSFIAGAIILKRRDA